MKKWWIAAFAVVNVGVFATAWSLFQNPSSPIVPSPPLASKPPIAPAIKPATSAIASNESSAAKKPEIPPKPAPSIEEPPPATLPPFVKESSETEDVPDSDIRHSLTIAGADNPPSNRLRPLVDTQLVAPNVAPDFKIRREGFDVVDLLGTVRRQSGRLEFVPADGSPPMTLLENQLLQRIDATLNTSSASESQRWRVTGVTTEYRQANYLLLKRVVAESR